MGYKVCNFKTLVGEFMASDLFIFRMINGQSFKIGIKEVMERTTKRDNR